MHHKSFLRETAGVLMRAVVVVLTIVVVISVSTILVNMENSVSDGSCNIAVLPVEGVIIPYNGLEQIIGDIGMVVTPDAIDSYLSAIEEDDSIEGVLLEINSPGGTPVAAERIAERIRSSELPVVGLVGDQGASGGYMVAAATDYLIASPMSSVGSIGVNMSYLEESKKNEEEGLTYVQLIAGEYKDMGSPDRPLTDEERAILQQDLDAVHNYFIDLVAEYREMPREEVVAVADGSSMVGARALEHNLIDQLGGRSEAMGIFVNLLSKDVSEIELCDYNPWLLTF